MRNVLKSAMTLLRFDSVSLLQERNAETASAHSGQRSSQLSPFSVIGDSHIAQVKPSESASPFFSTFSDLEDVMTLTFLPLAIARHISVPILEAVYLGPKIGAMRKSTHSAEYATLKLTLVQLRSAAGMSQRDLAKAIGAPHSWVAKVESGERRIDLIEFGWFCAACGASPSVQARKILTQGPPAKRRIDK